MAKKVFTTVGREEVEFAVDDQDYVLVPASGLAARRFREASFAGAEMEYSGDEADKRFVMRRLQGMMGVEPVLVAGCCFRVAQDGKRSPVTQDAVEAWPGEVQKWAFAECKRISPWLEERPEEGLAALKRQRDKLDERIKALEAADPKI